MPHLSSSRTAALLLLLPALLVPVAAPAEPAAPVAGPAPTAATSTPPAATPAPPTAPATPAAGDNAGAPAGAMPSPAQQAVLDRIRRLRDGDQRRFGSCSYRWDRWKLHADGTRTTTYSCEAGQIVDRTIGVNCSKLQINGYDPLPKGSGKADSKGEGWAWGSWRLPQPGGEERMVATLCANALPTPPPAAAPAGGASPSTPATRPPVGTKR